MKDSIQAKSQMDTLFIYFFGNCEKNKCLLENTKYTDYFFASIKKKRYSEVGRGEIPKLLKFSKFLTRIQIKNQSN